MMTACPNPIDFAALSTGSNQASISVRPNVTEHFWGYEVRPNGRIVDVAVLLRAVCGPLTIATLIAAVGIWLLPATAFFALTFAAKMTVSPLLGVGAFVLARLAARGTCVRIQIDTASGELREVVDGPFRNDIVLAHYGFDAIEAVDVVKSRSSASFGRVQISIDGIGPVAAGDGSLQLIAALRSRLASDCGLETARPMCEVI